MSQYKRYPEYKESGVEWLPNVPGHWVNIRIKRMATIENGRDYQTVYDKDGVVPIYGSGGQFSTSNTPLYIGESILIGRKGTLDRPLHVNGPFWTVDTMFYTRLHSQTHGRYFYYNILNFPFDLYSTNTALPSLTQADIGGHIISVPDKYEQTAIANFLDREISQIDALIQEKSKFIELLEEKRQALISHAVTKGLDPDAPMKDSGVPWLGEVPAHWERMIIKRLVTIENGRDYKDVFDETGTVPVYGSGGQFTTANASLYIGESVLIGRKGTLDKPLHVNGAFWTVDTMFYTKLNSNVYGRYFYYSMLNFPFNLHSTNTALPSLTQSAVGSHMLYVPSVDEQKEIAVFLDQAMMRVDVLVKKTARSIDLLREKRSALITAAVTGQIDVREEVV